MNSLRGPISHALALLAMALVPLQQALAASCCCHAGGNGSRPTVTRGQESYCMPAPGGWCADATKESVCASGRLSLPRGRTICDGLSGCHNRGDTKVPELPTAAETRSTDESSQAAIVTTVPDLVERVLVTRLLRTPRANARSGPRLCVSLCRLTL